MAASESGIIGWTSHGSGSSPGGSAGRAGRWPAIAAAATSRSSKGMHRGRRCTGRAHAPCLPPRPRPPCRPSRRPGRSPRPGPARLSPAPAPARGTVSTPASISASIASGSSERGLSLVRIATSARRADGGAHQRPLGPVPVTAAAQHDAQAAAGDRAQRAQHRFHRAWLVRIVHQQGEILARLDPLQAAGHSRAGGHPGDRRGQVHARLHQRDDRAEGVGDVVAARAAPPTRPPRPRRGRRCGTCCRPPRSAHVDGPPVRGRVTRRRRRW